MDYRKNQKVLLTFILEDKGQDFTEIDLLENGVILGYNILFTDGRLTMIGTGKSNGENYQRASEIIIKEMTDEFFKKNIKNSLIYFKPTNMNKDPLPWEANTFKYKIVGWKKPTNPDRFIIK